VIFFLPRDIVVGEGFLWRSKIPRSYVRTSVRFETKLIRGGDSVTPVARVEG
jgi:hypothetical protein